MGIMRIVDLVTINLLFFKISFVLLFLAQQDVCCIHDKNIRHTARTIVSWPLNDISPSWTSILSHNFSLSFDIFVVSVHIYFRLSCSPCPIQWLSVWNLKKPQSWSCPGDIFIQQRWKTSVLKVNLVSHNNSLVWGMAYFLTQHTFHVHPIWDMCIQNILCSPELAFCL